MKSGGIDDNLGGGPAAQSVRWPPKRELFGVGISIALYDQCLDALFAAAAAGVHCSVGHMGAHNLMMSTRDPELRRAFDEFELVTTDGQFVRFALNWLHDTALPERVTARDLMLKICERACDQGRSIYLFGDELATVTELKNRLRERFPGLVVAGCDPSAFRPLTSTEDEQLVTRVNASGASFLFVALGCPRQEMFVHAHRGRIHATQLCVGSAFKILAGHRRMAPAWMQRWCLEWVYHFAQDPRAKWKRYMVNYPPLMLRLLAGLTSKVLRTGRRQS